ncbi:MAG: hypothetical protein ACE5HI_19350, partial [bacterium]
MITRFHGQAQLLMVWLLQVIFPPAVLNGQDLAFRVNGYVKNLAVQTESIFTHDAAFLDLNRLRTKGLLNINSSIHTEIWLDSELLAGTFLSTQDFSLGQVLERPTYIDLSWTLKEGKRYQIRQSLFRAFSTVYAGNIEITLGRQRIAWGTGYVWNPTDLLNPFNPASIELEEKAGVDAAYIALPFGTLSRFEAAYAPGKHDLQPSVAFRLSSNLSGYDVSLMAGEFQDDKVLGGDFAGYIGGAGFRGEFAYTWKQGRPNFLRAILNTDYNFPDDYYAFIEFFYNGQGSTNKQNYNLIDLFSSQTFNLARLYIAASVSKSVTPLLRLSFYSILNLNDKS